MEKSRDVNLLTFFGDVKWFFKSSVLP